MPDADEIGGFSLSMDSGFAFVDDAAGSSVGTEVDDSPLACFLRFLVPESFLRECVRPCSASFRPLDMRRCLSASFVGRMTITLSSVYGSLHYAGKVSRYNTEKQ